MGASQVEYALELCLSYDAELPIPKNAQELADLNTAVLLYDQRIGNTYVFNLDGNDSDKDRIWRDSTGEEIQHLPWRKSFHPRPVENEYLFLQYELGWDGTGGYRDVPGKFSKVKSNLNLLKSYF